MSEPTRLPASQPLVIWTYDWVPEGPRGFVRDLRLRWACEEAGLAYTINAVPFEHRGADHFSRQPFGQVPVLEDGDLTLFESGACLLHLARKSAALMPREPKGEAETEQWVIAGLNSIEMVSVPWWFISLSGAADNPLEAWLLQRLAHLDTVLAERDWLAAGRFTVADLLMADILRVRKLRAFNPHPRLEAYVERVCARPAFQRAHTAQLAHFAAGSIARAPTNL